jgi:glycerol-3-phosphate dehydrogenase
MIDRGAAVATLATEEFELLVIGGGLTGAGVALDAASRGLTVGLVERRDFACGASSRSSKLLYGGLRCLRGLHAGLVREALAERELMRALAPRLVWPLPMVAPAGARGPGRHRSISAAEVEELVPALAGCRPPAGYLFHDYQTDDVRLVLTVLGEAERRGAVCANRLEAVELLEHGGRIAGVEVVDAERGGRFTIAADRVVNATGAWAGRLLARHAGDAPPFRVSRGIHLVLHDRDLPLAGAGVVLPSGRGRHVLAMPWLGRVLVGPTDGDHHGDIDEVRPLDREVDDLLDAVNAFFGTHLDRADVIGAFAGVRPPGVLHVGPAGVLTVTGGKLALWRRRAKRAIDRLLEQEGRTAPCRTHEIRLAPRPARCRAGDRHLATRYGPAADDVLALAAADPLAARPIVDGRLDVLAEAVHAARDEQAQSVGDVLLRRTRLGVLAAREVCEPAGGVALRVANAMAPALGWSDGRAAREAAAWAREAGAEGLVVNPMTQARTG